MIFPQEKYNFPQQRVSAYEKSKPYWYANSIDYVIDQGLAMNDRTDTETKLSILHGNIPNEFYKKTLNPYNSANERYQRFPATMRNLDIMSDIIRRYVSEYYKGVHEFVVGANNPDIVLNKDAKLKEQVMILAQQAFQQAFEQAYQQAIQEVQQNGQDPNSINPQDVMPDVEKFVADYNKKYIEDLVNIGELSRNEVMPYMIKRYEQILVNFNLAIGKQVYKNVKYDPDWIDDLEGL